MCFVFSGYGGGFDAGGKGCDYYLSVEQMGDLLSMERRWYRYWKMKVLGYLCAGISMVFGGEDFS